MLANRLENFRGKGELCMQSPTAFPRCRLHTCAHCIMCRLCLVAERWRCSCGLSMIDGWAGWALGALPCQQGACLHTPVHHQPLLLPAQLSGFPKQRLPFPRNKPSSWHLSQLEPCSFVRVCSLPPRAGVKLHSLLLVKLHPFTFVKRANMKMQGWIGMCSFFYDHYDQIIVAQDVQVVPQRSLHPPWGKDSSTGGVNRSSKVRLLHLQNVHP